jgi:hypothetical protein
MTAFSQQPFSWAAKSKKMPRSGFYLCCSREAARYVSPQPITCVWLRDSLGFCRVDRVDFPRHWYSRVHQEIELPFGCITASISREIIIEHTTVNYKIDYFLAGPSLLQIFTGAIIPSHRYQQLSAENVGASLQLLAYPYSRS